MPASLSTDSLRELKWLPQLPEERDPSLYALLTRLTEVATLQATLRKYASAVLGEQTFVPVLVSDEVHLLNTPDLKPVMDELLRFVAAHVHAKRNAAVTIVLLSSVAHAAETSQLYVCSAVLLSPCFLPPVPDTLPAFDAQGGALRDACGRSAWVTFTTTSSSLFSSS